MCLVPHYLCDKLEKIKKFMFDIEDYGSQSGCVPLVFWRWCHGNWTSSQLVQEYEKTARKAADYRNHLCNKKESPDSLTWMSELQVVFISGLHEKS